MTAKQSIRYIGIIVPLCALLYLIWINDARVRRVDSISNQPGRAEPNDIIDSAFLTGYANGQRELIIPERTEASFHWIAQSQQMLARREWRVRRVEYENAPLGVAVESTSPYRWWLGLVAWGDHLYSARPLGLSVERAALYADPLLQMLLLVGATILVGWQFGLASAVLLSLGLVSIFPFAGAFLPGAPDHHGFAGALILLSLLALVIGMRSILGEGASKGENSLPRRGNGWFVFAGMVSGIGVWIGVSVQIPVLAGVFVGGLLAAWIKDQYNKRLAGDVYSFTPWRLWAFAGALTVLFAWLIECFPDRLGGWHLDSIHPLYSIAWLGVGELLVSAERWIEARRLPKTWRGLAIPALSILALAAIPIVIWKTGGQGILTRDLLWFRLTNLPGGPTNPGLWAWILHAGLTPAFWATVLPLALTVPSVYFIFAQPTDPETRVSIALILGPLLIALGFAGWKLSWWNILDVILLAMLVAASAAQTLNNRWKNAGLWLGIIIVFAIPGFSQLIPGKGGAQAAVLTSSEAEELIERDLAHWLAKRSGDPGAIVFAPPNETTTLCFYGGLRGIGTFDVDNPASIGTTIRIASATSIMEVQELLTQRQVRYIILPSWDPFFEDYARLYSAKNHANWESGFIHSLQQFDLPLWLRPISYTMPKIGGYESQNVLVFEVVDEPNPATAMARLAEYFIEMGDLDRAAAAGQALRRFPGDVSALAALAQVQSARGETADFEQTLDLLASRMSGGADRRLPWDRKVSLAIVLARGKRIDAAREHVRSCIAELNEKKLRGLSTNALYNLMVLSRGLDLPITNEKQHALALDLLPPDLRGRF